VYLPFSGTHESASQAASCSVPQFLLTGVTQRTGIQTTTRSSCVTIGRIYATHVLRTCGLITVTLSPYIHSPASCTSRITNCFYMLGFDSVINSVILYLSPRQLYSSRSVSDSPVLAPVMSSFCHSSSLQHSLAVSHLLHKCFHHRLSNSPSRLPAYYELGKILRGNRFYLAH